jgi:predicted secreted Zn-dependent protease
MPDLTWQKSSYSMSGDCIETSRHGPYLLIRDTDNPDKILYVTANSWQAFLQGVKAGEFDQDTPAQP